MQLCGQHITNGERKSKLCGLKPRQYEGSLFVPLGVSRSSVEGPQSAAFSKKLFCRSLVRIQRRGEILLLLLDVVKSLINVILFPLHSLDMGKQSSQLYHILSDDGFDECGVNKNTLLPFSIKARSHTATSPANLLNSRTCTSSSDDHLFTISSMVFPLSADGGGTATEVVAAVVANSRDE